jgi:hypothetical protein
MEVGLKVIAAHLILIKIAKDTYFDYEALVQNGGLI